MGWEGAGAEGSAGVLGGPFSAVPSVARGIGQQLPMLGALRSCWGGEHSSARLRKSFHVLSLTVDKH